MKLPSLVVLLHRRTRGTGTEVGRERLVSWWMCEVGEVSGIVGLGT